MEGSYLDPGGRVTYTEARDFGIMSDTGQKALVHPVKRFTSQRFGP